MWREKALNDRVDIKIQKLCTRNRRGTEKPHRTVWSYGVSRIFMWDPVLIYTLSLLQNQHPITCIRCRQIRLTLEYILINWSIIAYRPASAMFRPRTICNNIYNTERKEGCWANRGNGIWQLFEKYGSLDWEETFIFLVAAVVRLLFFEIYKRLEKYLDNPTIQPGLTDISRQSNNTANKRDLIDISRQSNNTVRSYRHI